MMRHEHIVDLVAAIESRLTSLCPSLKSVGRSQATSYKDLAKLIPQLSKLPAAVVVLGPVDGDQERSSQGARPRVVDLGVMLVGEYDADADEGAPAHWAILDEVHDAFTPAVGRSEKPGLPVAVLGTQDGAARGTLLIPGGYRPMTEVTGRCAGVYNLLALDTLAERTGLPVEPAEPAAPETGLTSIADADRLTVWLYSAGAYLRRFISGSALRAALKAYFDTIYDASGAAGTVQTLALTPAELTPEVSSPFAINYATSGQVQDLGTVSSPLILTKGTGWPNAGTLAYVRVRLLISGTPTITWTIVNKWTTEVPAADGEYILHLSWQFGAMYASAEVVQ